MAHIKFTTDSASDIPPAMREELGIQVLPFPIAMEDQEYQDGFDFTPEEFYDMLLSAPKIPTHAQLNPYVFTEMFEQAWQEGFTDLIHTSINSKGSATCANAYQARDDFYKDHPEAADSFHIHIIDALNYTMGYGWAVVQGAKMAAQGAGAQETVDFIQDWVDHVRVIFSPLDLRFAKKSGRVSAAAAFVGEALGLKPVMTFSDGESKILSKIRGEKALVAKLVEMCKNERRPGTPYLLIQGNNHEQSDKLREACRQELGEEAALAYCIGGVIAINAGPNLIGVIYRV
ncbi:DegV family protein [Pseudoflavonifractor sp. 60]|uniref:DegV family protein n=1 Tax=Pseudoflavonifractor sp. 60 TaxID=2304576 RepID=UPI00136C7A28|nr:DegV family protein [Pseudoflavonifractor sp. 60]